MTKSVFLFAAGFVLMPLVASARTGEPNPSLLAWFLENFDWPGVRALDLAEAPVTPQFVPADGPSSPEEIGAALKWLATSATTARNPIGATANALGLDPEVMQLEFRGITTRPDADGVSRYFKVTEFRGVTLIVIEEKIAMRSELRSYLVSVEGILKAAVVTTQPAGPAYETKKINLDAARPDFNKLLDHWVRYYRNKQVKQKA